MIHTVDPRQNRHFDPFDGVIPPVGRRIIADGWQGLFHHVLLNIMPVAALGRHFSDSLGGTHQGASTPWRGSSSSLTSSAGPPRRPSRPPSSAPTSSTP